MEKDLPSSPPPPYHYLTKCPFSAVPVSQPIVYGYQEKVTKHNTKQREQFKDPEQTSHLELAKIRIIQPEM